MYYRQDPVFEQNNQIVEQIMIEQLKKVRFPAISQWNPEGIAEEDGIPLLTWESFRQFISDTSGIRIPKDIQLILTRHPGYSSVEHCHDHYEACYILSGNCSNIVNNHLEYLKKGDFCLMPPLARHDYKFFPDSLVLCFSIHPTFFSGTCAPLLNEDTPFGRFLLESLYKDNREQYLLFQTEDDYILRILAMTMLQIMMGAEEPDKLTLDSLLLGFFSKMLKHPCRHVQNSPSGSRLLDLELLNMIRQNYATITLTDLSKHLHYTVPHCSKYLKEHLGCTFSELVRQMRFQAAEDYLIHSDMNVSQISETLGYENPENFIRAFKKIFGVTPTKYRQMNR